MWWVEDLLHQEKEPREIGLPGLDLWGEAVSLRPLLELRLELAHLLVGSFQPLLSWRQISGPAFLWISSTFN